MWLLRWQRIHLQCRRPWFNSWVRKICWRRHSYPLQYSGLVTESDTTEQLSQLQLICGGLYQYLKGIFSQPCIALFSLYFQSQLWNSGAVWSFDDINTVVPLLFPLLTLGLVFSGTWSQSVPLYASAFQLPNLVAHSHCFAIFYLMNIILVSCNGILGRSRT